MSSKKINYLMMLLIIIIFLFVLSIIIVFTIKNSFYSVNEDDVVLDTDSNTVIIKSMLTVSDEFGKTIADSNNGYYGYLEFSVSNLSSKSREYEILIKKSDINPVEIDGNYVKFYLTDYNNRPFDEFSNNILPDYESMRFLSDKPGNKLLHSGSLKGLEIEKFKLRVWIADSYNIISNDAAFTFVISARAV